MESLVGFGLGVFRLIGVAVLLALVVAGCGEVVPRDSGPISPPGSGMGPGISVTEALASQLEGPLLVNGWLWSRDGKEVRLCTGLTGSTPPRCAEPSLALSGFDLSGAKGLQSAEGVTWSQQPVQLLGELSDRTLVVSGRSKA